MTIGRALSEKAKHQKQRSGATVCVIQYLTTLLLPQDAERQGIESEFSSAACGIVVITCIRYNVPK